MIPNKVANNPTIAISVVVSISLTLLIQNRLADMPAPHTGVHLDFVIRLMYLLAEIQVLTEFRLVAVIL